MREITLVTGGLGFLGRHLVDQLLSAGESVRVLDTAAPANNALAEVDYITGSICDRPTVERAMAGVRRVYHTAAKAGLWAADKGELYRVNQIGTRIVLQAAQKAGVERIVHTSTESILKSRTGPPSAKLLDETVQLNETDMCGDYCRAKFLAEQEALDAAARGVPVVVVNPSVPVGPGDFNLTPPSRMLLGFLNGRFPAYMESTLNLVDVRDVANGHIRAADRGRLGQRYLLGNENIRLADLLVIMKELTGLSMSRRRVPYWLAFTASAVQEWRADHLTHRPPTAPLTGVRLARTPLILDNARARTELGLEFRPLRESLADAIRWFQEQGLLLRRPKKPLGK